ncbi:hypothetical protein [Mesorhizobium sp.]|uniref:hypothetical protein n=1 Tax=Mesorhizobium sp. TaxID=1871066 RepID=UPI0025F48DE9|nr:hypothetical protein [Mesorhizobium sp.]
MTRPRAVPKDAHLPLVGHREIEAGKIELARAIFAVGEEEGRAAIEVLEKLKQLDLIDEPVPYLAVREDILEGGSLRRVIVVRQNLAVRRVEQSTELDAGDLTTEDLEDREKCPPAAAKALTKYAEERHFRQQVLKAPGDIRLSTILTMYVERLDPSNVSPEAKELREYEARLEGEKSPWASFANANNCATHLIEWLEDTTVGQMTKNIGQDYMDDMRLTAKKRGGKDAQGRTIALYQDLTILGHLSIFNVALAWFVREFRPAVRIEYDRPVAKTADKICLTWEEVRRAIMFCLGYIWDGTQFVTERVFVDGEWREVLARRPFEEYERYIPLIRFLIVYFLTGTRFKQILKLGWAPLNFRGWISLDHGWIYRNGRKSKRHARKPREASQLLPVLRDLFASWFADDERMRVANNWTQRPPHRRRGKRNSEDVDEAGFFVVHDGSGNPVPLSRVQDLITEVFAAVGIEATGHKLKHGGVTIYHEAGFALAQISFFFGTTERVLDEAYRNLKNAESTFGIRPAPPDPATITLPQLLDPHSRLDAPAVAEIVGTISAAMAELAATL